MPLQLPPLDDRQFEDLMAEARGLIPTYAPGWTNHNPSDPGITLVELLAHLTEMLIYRLDRVTAANYATFLNLLDGKRRTAADLEGRVADEIRSVVLELRRKDRAVTAADFERLALEADSMRRIARARCVPRRNLVADLERDRPGHVSVIVVPSPAADVPISALTSIVQAYLEPRALLTTRVHVVGPYYIDVGLRATVAAFPDRPAARVRSSVVDAVTRLLDPHPRDGGCGWPFGRNVFASELYAAIDRLEDVDHIQDLTVTVADPKRVLWTDGPNRRLIGVEVRPHELVRARIVEADVDVQSA